MSNDIDCVNDSGIPMEGVELDSSTVTPNSPNQLASITNSTSAANSSNIRTSSNNEAVASNDPILCDESKCGESYSPDYDQSYNSGAEENSSQTNSSQHDKNGQAKHSASKLFVKRFGDLFDDDDLD